MSTTILVVGVILGVVQLAAGVGIGLWLAQGAREKEGPGGEDRKRAQRLANELRTLTASLSSQAREQGDMLRRVDSRLQSEAAKDQSLAEHPLTSLVTGVVREMMTANLQLQQKLANAELEIENQAGELAEHRQQAMTDPLTGLPNRRSLDDHLRLRMDAWRRHGTPFSVVMLDVDHFKRFNDTHGHPAGDQALKTVGQALRSALRQHDVVARYGGEEFAVILPHTTLETAQGAVQKAVGAIRDTPVMVEGSPIEVTASAGLASLLGSEHLEDLMQRADQALYSAKENGRDRAWLHDGKDTCPLGLEASGEPLEVDPTLAAACGDLRDSMAAMLAD